MDFDLRRYWHCYRVRGNDVAIYRRSFTVGVFSGAGWFYIAVIFSDHWIELQTRLPTTVVLVESWYARYGNDVAIMLSGQGVSFDKTYSYEHSPLTAYAAYPEAAQKVSIQFENYYASGHTLFALIFATIASQIAAFLQKPTKNE